jgi:hypothetical protein
LGGSADDQPLPRGSHRDVLQRPRVSALPRLSRGRQRAKVRIDTLEVIKSDLGRRQLRFVLAWAELHREELETNWRRAQAREKLLPIEPLK